MQSPVWRLLALSKEKVTCGAGLLNWLHLGFSGILLPSVLKVDVFFSGSLSARGLAHSSYWYQSSLPNHKKCNDWKVWKYTVFRPP